MKTAPFLFFIIYLTKRITKFAITVPNTKEPMKKKVENAVPDKINIINSFKLSYF